MKWLDPVKRDGQSVYVPKPESRLRRSTKSGGIAPGSGIVGTVQDDGSVLIYYEGNLYDAVNMRRYDERVMHAYDRMTWQGRGYPTTAMMVVNASELVEVGMYDPETQTIIVSDQATLDEWLGCVGATP